MDSRDYTSSFNNKGIIHKPTIPLRLPSMLRRIIYPLVCSIALCRVGKQCSLILAEQAHNAHAVIGSTLCHKPLIVWYRYRVKHGRAWSLFRYTKEIACDVMETFTLRRCDGIIAVNEQLKKDALRRGSCKRIKVVPHFIDTELFSKKTNVDWIKKEYDLRDRKVITFLGRLSPIKAVDVLIRAFKLVKEEVKNSVLMIIGDGTERKRLERVCAELGVLDSVIFTGNIRYKKLPQHLSVSDLFVSPSRSEGQSRALLEVMSMGIPVIVTQIEGNLDLVNHGENGIFVKSNCSKEIAHSIMSLLRNTGYASLLGRNARNFIVKKFSEEKIYEEHFSFILETLNQI